MAVRPGRAVQGDISTVGGEGSDCYAGIATTSRSPVSDDGEVAGACIDGTCTITIHPEVRPRLTAHGATVAATGSGDENVAIVCCAVTVVCGNRGSLDQKDSNLDPIPS